MYKIQQDETWFYFSTQNGITYSVSFELVDFNSFKRQDFYLLNINIENYQGFIPYDRDVAKTIVKIINNFITSNDCFCVFTCDTSDGRQLARFRKFDFWYHKYNDGTFLKYDRIVVSKSTQKNTIHRYLSNTAKLLMIK
jgi:hypothetical protein